MNGGRRSRPCRRMPGPGERLTGECWHARVFGGRDHLRELNIDICNFRVHDTQRYIGFGEA